MKELTEGKAGNAREVTHNLVLTLGALSRLGWVNYLVDAGPGHKSFLPQPKSGLLVTSFVPILGRFIRERNGMAVPRLRLYLCYEGHNKF